MIEVEIKLPVEHTEEIIEKLAAVGFVRAGFVCEEDCYFDNGCRQIRNNGEALRIRKITDLLTDRSESVVTFKGKKMDRVSMSRKELETEVDDAETCMQILESLGFKKIPPEVVKYRQEFKCSQVTACVDRVQDLGDFLELEMVIPETGSKDSALQQIEKILKELGYSIKDTTRNSYLSMLQQVEDE